MTVSSVTRPISYVSQQHDMSKRNRVNTSSVSFKDALSRAAVASGEESASPTFTTQSNSTTTITG